MGARTRGALTLLRPLLLLAALLAAARAAAGDADAAGGAAVGDGVDGGGEARTASTAWHHAPFEGLLADDARAAAHAALHARTRAPLVLPLELTVALVGLDGDGALGARIDARALGKLLTSALRAHRPASLDARAPLAASVELSYNVVHLRAGAATALEHALRTNMRPVTSSQKPSSASASASRSYEVEATALEHFFDAAYDAHFVPDALPLVPTRLAPYVLFIVSPDVARVDPSPPPANASLADARREYAAWGPLGLSAEEVAAASDGGGFSYRYRYAGGAPTAAWLSSGRYAVADLSAAPCAHGRLGGAAAASLPRVAAALAPYAAAAAALRADAAAAKAHDGGGMNAPGVARSAAALAHRFESQLRAELAALVISSVRHVFAPDVRTKALDVAARVLVPLISLADHRAFVPIDTTAGDGHNGDGHNDGHNRLHVGELRRQAARLLAPGQELLLAPSPHALHAHPRLALALRRALRAHSPPVTAFAGGGNGTSGSAAAARIGVPLLDAGALLAELRASGDLLASGLLGLNDPALEATFFNRQLPVVAGSAADADAAAAGAVLSAAAGAGGGGASYFDAAAAPPGGGAKKAAAQQPPGRSGGMLGLTAAPAKGSKASSASSAASAASARAKAHSHGTRVVPTYLFSLRDVPPGLLLDGEALHAGGRDAVLLLQTGDADADASSSPAHGGSPFYAAGARASVSGGAPLRAALAGLAGALGGVAPPYLRHATASSSGDGDGGDSLDEEWLWGMGAHPFGPFSNYSGGPLSQLLVDAAHRNAILTRTHAALGHVRRALRSVDAFGERFLARPLGEPLRKAAGTGAGTGADAARGMTWLDRMAAEAPPPADADADGASAASAASSASAAHLAGRLPSAVLARLQRELGELESQFLRLSRLMYEGALPQAHVLSSHALIGAYTLREYAAAELAAAREDLACCRVVVRPPGRGGRGGGRGGGRRVSGGGVAAIAAAAFVGGFVAAGAAGAGGGGGGGGGGRKLRRTSSLGGWSRV
jgi:hypothetical protein